MCPRKLYNYIPTPEEEEVIFEPEHIFCSKACGYRHIITKAALCLLCRDKLSATEQGSWEFVAWHSLLIGDSPVGLECSACPNRLTRVHDVNECLACLRKHSEYQKFVTSRPVVVAKADAGTRITARTMIAFSGQTNYAILPGDTRDLLYSRCIKKFCKIFFRDIFKNSARSIRRVQINRIIRL